MSKIRRIKLLTQARLKEVLRYDIEDGSFRWIKSAGAVKAGNIAGSVTDRGYLSIGVDMRQYRAHRLAWLYMTGSFPVDQTDHINRNRLDNRWVNLREATSAENKRNRALQANNTSGSNGVVWNARNRKWVAQIKLNGEYKWLGSYMTKLAAAYARHQANINYGFELNHGGEID